VVESALATIRRIARANSELKGFVVVGRARFMCTCTSRYSLLRHRQRIARQTGFASSVRTRATSSQINPNGAEPQLEVPASFAAHWRARRSERCFPWTFEIWRCVRTAHALSITLRESVGLTMYAWGASRLESIRTPAS
jgi:hypothetical protein